MNIITQITNEPLKDHKIKDDIETATLGNLNLTAMKTKDGFTFDIYFADIEEKIISVKAEDENNLVFYAQNALENINYYV